MTRPRSSLARTAVTALAAVVLAACSAGTPASPAPSDRVPVLSASPAPTATATPIASVSASASPVAEAARAPKCANRPTPAWVTQRSTPNDGIPDPAGRIVFGQVARNDQLMGPIVAPLFAMDADGSDLVQILDCEVSWPRLSPDGSRLALSVTMDDGTQQVATSAPDGSDLRILTTTSGYADTPDWSPDGTWLIYANSTEHCAVYPACTDDGTTRPTLWRVDADGSGERPIGDPAAIDTEPHISPDGREVVYDHLDPKTSLFAFMIRDLATGKDRRVFAADRDLEHPAWSPDGHSIVYNTLSGPGGRFMEQIQQAPANDPTAKPNVLYGDLGRTGYKPSYSPDGSGIVFGCDGNICRMAADGSKVVVLVKDVPGKELNYPTWGAAPPAGD
jgi:Tol biopolymer transport system component